MSEALKEFLQHELARWRKKKAGKSTEQERLMASCYVDAYRCVEKILEAVDDDTRPFPIQGCLRNHKRWPRGGKSAIPWWLAEIAYIEYGPANQDLECLAERGGFGREELLMLVRREWCLPHKMQKLLRRMEAAAKEHEKAELSSRRVAMQSENRGQKTAYKQIVKHLRELLGKDK